MNYKQIDFYTNVGSSHPACSHLCFACIIIEISHQVGDHFVVLPGNCCVLYCSTIEYYFMP